MAKRKNVSRNRSEHRSVTPDISRRNFLKIGALSLGTLGLGPLVHGPGGAAPALAATRIGRLNSAAPGFAPLPSSTLLTGAAADVSVGWDGSIWAIDADGLTHSYDPLRQTWQPFGTGVDAFLGAFAPNDLAFRGAEVVAYQQGQTPQPIGTLWPQLPASFKLGVDGAALIGGVAYLFKNGRYLRADMQQPARSLSDISGWPGSWDDGLIDAVGISIVADGKVLLLRGTQWAVLDLSASDMGQHRIVAGPAPLSAVFGPRLAALLASGVDTLLLGASAAAPGGAPLTVFRGPLAWEFDSGSDANAAILPVWARVGAGVTWPPTWTPQLAHAPSGRSGALWAATAAGDVVSHTGTGWTQAPAASGGPVLSAAVDVDGSVYAATASALHTLGSGGTAWQQLAQAPGGATLVQVTAGDDAHVWARATNGQVHRFDTSSGTLTPVVGLTAGHLAAGYDGTLWHADGSANAYRLIPEGTEPSQALAVAGATNIRKVSTTGFGTSVVLGGSGVLYSYQSPYVFKTAASYTLPLGSTITQGQNLLFVTSTDETDAATVVALDAQSGVERWRFQLPEDVLATNPVYDAPNQAVICGDSDGYVTAFGAGDGNVLWRFQTDNGEAITSTPALAGTMLVFGDENGYVYAIDTADALRRAQAGQPPVTLWPPYETAPQYPRCIVFTPLLADGQIYVVTKADQTLDNDAAIFNQLNAGGTPVYSTTFSGGTGSSGSFGLVRADHNFGDGETTPAVLVDSGDTIYAISLTSPGIDSYPVKSGNTAYFSSGMALYNNILYVGDSSGYLYALDETFTPVFDTPVLISGVGDTIFTQPLVVEDNQNNITVLVGAEGSAAVWAYPVSSSTPTPVELIATGLTQVNSLSRNAVNGTIYAGGSESGQAISVPQIFGLRIDAEISTARDFMIESQLLQDFDDPPAGQQAAVAVARYQTTLSVVDNTHVARAFEAVKIWAEQPNTLLSIDGVQYTAGPGDADCVVTRTDGSGRLSIISGSLQGDTDATRATDLFAAPLRVWAGFMDPFERVIIYPDREFHTRVAGTVATSGTPRDPDTINLSTATDYSGAQFKGQPLFGPNQQTQATQIADIIKTVSGATNLKPQSTQARPRLAAARGPDISKYTPDGYNLPGMSYFPSNVPATRPALALAPAGLSFVGPGSVAPSYNTLSVADAAAAIDALEGVEWTNAPGIPAVGPLVGGFWSSFWKFIKSAAAEITHIIVSIGKEIYAGIRFVVNGIAYFFKNPLGALEDLVSMIGSFFIMLGKLIKNVIEAIGLLFNFEHILATKDILRGVYDDAMATLETDLTTAQKLIDTQFENAEKQVDGWFETLIAQVAPPSGAGKPLTGFGGIGKTDHDAFSVGPNGAAGQSRTVQCSWAADKARHHWQSATEPPATQAFGDVDPITAFFEGFVDSLSTNPERQQSFDEAKARFKSKLSFSSVEDFFSSLAADLLEAAKLVVEAGLLVGQALVDGLFGLVGAMVSALQNLGKIRIPILSSLWFALTGEELTYIDLLLLVVAIPVTLLYRVVEGSYPDAALASAATNSQLLRRLTGIGTGCIYIFAGIFTALLDTLRVVSGGPLTLRIGPKIVGGLLLLAQFGNDIYLAIAKNRIGLDWMSWAASLGQILTTLLGTVPTQEAEMSVIGALLGVLIAMFGIARYLIQSDPTQKVVPIALTDTINAIVVQIPAMINPLKLAPIESLIPLIVPAGDLACRVGSGAVTIIHTVRTWDQVVAPPPPAPSPVVRGHRFLPQITDQP